MNKIASIFLIFCLNAMLTFLYIYFVVGSFSMKEVTEVANPDTGACTNNIYACYLWDIISYSYEEEGGILDRGFAGIIAMLSIGTTGIHAVVLGQLFGSNSLSVILMVNSFFVALSVGLFPGGDKSRLISYILFAPFFVVFSVGWTKEIIFILALSFFVRSVVSGLRMHSTFAILFTLLARPQYSPLLFFAYWSKNISQYRLIFFLLLFLALSPYWLALRPDVYIESAQVFYAGAAQGASVYTDYLKENIPIVSVLGYMASILKLYVEPIISLLTMEFGTINVLILVQFYVWVVFAVALRKSSSKFYDNKIILNLFLFYNVFVSALPFTQFRYLMPLLIVLVLYQRSMGIVMHAVKTRSVLGTAAI